MIGNALGRLGPASVHWLLDQPVSNSGRLAAKITDLAEQANWPWTVQVVFNPDAAIVASSSIAITSDSAILDRVERWADFKTYLLEREVPDAWIVVTCETIDNGTNPPYLPARQRTFPASFPQQTELRQFGAHEYPRSRESN